MHVSRLSASLSRRTFLTRASRAIVLASAVFALPPARDAFADNGAQRALRVPVGVAPGEHWVDVDLSNQTAAAMRGGEVVRVALVTTGKPGWETPTGSFRILYRVADETMTSAALGIPIDSPDGYDLDHVLWTQYFTNAGHALHDNYWQPESVFGHEPTSHGCVGMVEEDAHFFWTFVGDGSLVHIHY